MFDYENTTKKTYLINFGILLLFCIITAGIYSNTLNSPFLFDDNVFIVRDPAIRMNEISWNSLKTAAIEGRPKNRYLPKISFAVNYYFGQYNVLGYHLTNIVIHILCAFFLFLFIRDTLALTPAGKKTVPAHAPPEMIAALSSLLWLVYPVHTESVTYISQRMTSLAAMFFILSLWLYCRARWAYNTRRFSFRSSLWFAGSTFAGLCAFASKENTGTLPLIILLYEWFFFQDLKLALTRRHILWITGMAFIFVTISIYFLGKNPVSRILNAYNYREFTLPQRVMTEWRVIIYYLSLLIWPSPSRLNLDHDYPLSFGLFDPFTTFLSLSALMGLTLAAIYLAHRNRLISFCILWFLITLLIESSIIGIEIIFEHRTYLPFMMICCLPVLLIFKTSSKPFLPITVILIIVLVFSAWTYQRNKIWHDPVTFWEDCAKKSSKDYRPYFNLGIAYLEAGMPEKAILQFKNVLKLWNFKNVLQKKDIYPDTLCNMGNAFMDMGQPAKAIDYYRKALAANPRHREARNNLANVLIEQNRIQEALVHLNYILKQNPDSEAYINTGSALARLNRIDSAIACFEKALKINPASAEAYNNLGVMMLYKKNYAAAMSDFQNALKFKPDHKSAIANLKLLKQYLNKK